MNEEATSGLLPVAGEGSPVGDAAQRLCLPAVSDRALAGLKFGAALPRRLAVATLAARAADLVGAEALLTDPVRFSALAD